MLDAADLPVTPLQELPGRDHFMLRAQEMRKGSLNNNYPFWNAAPSRPPALQKGRDNHWNEKLR